MLCEAEQPVDIVNLASQACPRFSGTPMRPTLTNIDVPFPMPTRTSRLSLHHGT